MKKTGPFEIKDNAGGVVGIAKIISSGAMILFTTQGPFGRQDIRAIAHELFNIADYDTGLKE